MAWILAADIPSAASSITYQHENPTENELALHILCSLAQIYYVPPNLPCYCVSLCSSIPSSVYFCLCINLTTPNLFLYYWVLQFAPNSFDIGSDQSSSFHWYIKTIFVSDWCCKSPQIALTYLFLIKITKVFLAYPLVCLSSFACQPLLCSAPPNCSSTPWFLVKFPV